MQRNFPTSKETFQLRSVLSNFCRFFPISLGSFQLQRNFLTSKEAFQLRLALFNFRLSNLKLSNFSFFPTALSNYTHPDFLGDFLKIWNLVWILFPEMTVGDTPKM